MLGAVSSGAWALAMPAQANAFGACGATANRSVTIGTGASCTATGSQSVAFAIGEGASVIADGTRNFGLIIGSGQALAAGGSNNAAIAVG